MTAERYEKLSAPFRGREKPLGLFNRALTLTCYICYPLLMLVLLIQRDPRFLRALLVPGISFAAVSAVRRCISFPRPYEVLDITPLIHKDTKGKSMPSRHVFSVFIIAMTYLWLLPPAGVALLAIGVLLAAVRVIGGVHFPRDVIVGAAIGIAAGVIGYWVI